MKHGDGEHIHAVIWFCDFRDSTPLSKSMGRQAYLRQLNRFFYCMAGAVLEAGGEVLRYIGDAVLAIFPIEEIREVLRAVVRQRGSPRQGSPKSMRDTGNVRRCATASGCVSAP